MYGKMMGTLSLMTALLFTGCASGLENTNNSSASAQAFDLRTSFSESEEMVLPALYGEGMVLQRGKVKITGTVAQDTDVAVIFNEKTYWGKAENGKFSIEIPDIEAGGPYRLTVRTETYGKTFEKVFVGDVFLLGGQSNMSMTLGGCDIGLAVKYSNEEVHLFTVGQQFADTPQKKVQGEWVTGNAAANKNFSAIGAIFADAMQKKEKVPVAAVCASLGGTMTSTWLPEEEASAISDIPYINAENYPNTSEPSKCYNGMIAPLADYAFKGVLWYQGENQTQKQEELLSGVICGWRRAFEDSGLPFLVIELPRYEVKEEPTRWAEIRQAQKKAADALENVWMCCTIDTGDRTDLHPTDKEIVALRCAVVGRNAFYGENLYTGPEIIDCKISDGKMLLTVSAEGDLTVKGALEDCFEIRENGKSFVKAQAVLEGNTIIVWGIENPVQVRYCFTSFPEPAVFDASGQPLDQYVSPEIK